MSYSLNSQKGELSDLGSKILDFRGWLYRRSYRDKWGLLESMEFRV